MELVVRNLLENAIKYSPPGTPIEIRAAHQGSEVLVTVEDHGPGLKPGDEERIFEKFYRTPQHSGASGVGLGLAIARAVVTAHGGRIWAERGAAGGAQFHFTIVLDGAPPSVDADPPPSEPGRPPEAS
jgi:two-component system sensor histidine kinase KdpD